MASARHDHLDVDRMMAGVLYHERVWPVEVGLLEGVLENRL